jgi:hypothetical protein
MIEQLALLAFTYQDARLALTLLTLGSHENFYRDIKYGLGKFTWPRLYSSTRSTQVTGVADASQ